MKFAQYLKKLQKIYQELDAELQLNAPADASQWQTLADTMGRPLDKELQKAWLTANGSGRWNPVFARPGFLSGYDFLSITDALAARTRMAQRAPQYADYVEEEPRDARIQAGWFQSGWLPFAEYGGGGLLLLIDYSPSATGQAGQIIAFSHDPDEISYVAASFSEFLASSIEEITENPEEFVPESEDF